MKTNHDRYSDIPTKYTSKQIASNIISPIFVILIITSLVILLWMGIKFLYGKSNTETVTLTYTLTMTEPIYAKGSDLKSYNVYAKDEYSKDIKESKALIGTFIATDAEDGEEKIGTLTVNCKNAEYIKDVGYFIGGIRIAENGKIYINLDSKDKDPANGFSECTVTEIKVN